MRHCSIKRKEFLVVICPPVAYSLIEPECPASVVHDLAPTV
jgi:hypothetical protein